MKMSWLGLMLVLFCALSLNSVHFSHDTTLETDTYLTVSNVTSDHPHSHDDIDDDKGLGHVHGHNANDHSHDNAITTIRSLKTSDLHIASLISIPQNSLFFDLSYGIDRPPRA